MSNQQRILYHHSLRFLGYSFAIAAVSMALSMAAYT